jgi:hypothetical protein
VAEFDQWHPEFGKAEIPVSLRFVFSQSRAVAVEAISWTNRIKKGNGVEAYAFD